MGFGLCCILPGIVLGGLAFWGFNGAKDLVGCTLNIAAIKKSITQYTDEHDGKLPAAATWQTDLAPYVQKQLSKMKEGNPFKTMDANGDWGCSDKDVLTSGFAFNSELSGKKLSEIKDRQTVMVFEIDKVGRNQSMPYKPQDPSHSPTIFGKQRGWYFLNVSGETVLHTANGDKATNTSVNVD